MGLYIKINYNNFYRLYNLGKTIDDDNNEQINLTDAILSVPIHTISNSSIDFS